MAYANHTMELNGGRSKKQKPLFARLELNIEEENLVIFKKLYVMVLENVGMSYDVQESFHTEGYFTIKVTPLGANLCLLEEMEEGELKIIMDEAQDWLAQWFS
ncbi:unnamed protein product [Lathyrus sativus]|nr:unnamed protein product [Lathyrus sativus]